MTITNPDHAGSARSRGYLPIGAYALIGDCHTAALVGLDGSIDWYCPHRFDAPAVFCRLLDDQKGGYFQVKPVDMTSSHRRYREGSNVLETTFEAASARVRLTDLMPIFQREASHRGYDVGSHEQILRLVEVIEGEAEIEIRFRPTFDYARARARVRRISDGVMAAAGEETLSLLCPGAELSIHPDGLVHGRIRLRAGERRWLILTAGKPGDAADLDPDRKLAETHSYWSEWSGACSYRGPYREEVTRSALVLKLLTYEPTGAVIAAPTTSLPEEIGGVRNWDYRYAWLRDSALILYSLITVGYHEEARDFLRWLEDIEQANPARKHQIMYTIDGKRDLPEVDLPHLEGYRGSRPVRIGNGAAGQRQLDIYGELLSAAFVYYKAGREDDDPATPARPNAAMWALLSELVDEAAAHWRESDQGIWEVRGGPQPFLYSRLMCWAALDRGVKLAETNNLPADLGSWRATRDASRRTILDEGYDAERGYFAQALGSDVLDASALTVPLVGFLPPTDPRVVSTVDIIRAHLTHDGLVYRYLAEDGLPGGEGTFALCTFWLVSALALGGRVGEAQDLFEQLLGYANDVGLFGEEIEPDTGDALGNFPQGFTHLGLISAAVNLDKAAAHGAEEHAQSEGERAEPARAAASGDHAGARRRKMG